jgi:hypothetical protein
MWVVAGRRKLLNHFFRVHAALTDSRESGQIYYFTQLTSHQVYISKTTDCRYLVGLRRPCDWDLLSPLRTGLRVYSSIVHSYFTVDFWLLDMQDCVRLIDAVWSQRGEFARGVFHSEVSNRWIHPRDTYGWWSRITVCVGVSMQYCSYKSHRFLNFGNLAQTSCEDSLFVYSFFPLQVLPRTPLRIKWTPPCPSVKYAWVTSAIGWCSWRAFNPNRIPMKKTRYFSSCFLRSERSLGYRYDVRFSLSAEFVTISNPPFRF